MSVMNWRVWPKEELVEVVDAIEIVLLCSQLKVVIGMDNR